MAPRTRVNRIRQAAALLAWLVVLVVCAWLVPAAPASAQAGYSVELHTGTARQVRVPAGQAVTVNTRREIGDIRVADPGVAQVAPLDTLSLYLLGLKSGRTTVSVYDVEKQPIGVIQVEVGVDVNDLRRALGHLVPDAHVTVTTVNGKLRLGGKVPDGQALATVLDLAQQYVGEDGEFINAMKVTESQQVLLEVRFLEANRRAGRELGVEIAVNDPSGPRGLLTGDTGFATANVDGSEVYTGGLQFPNAGNQANSFNFPLTGNAAFGTLMAKLISSTIDVDLFIRAVESNGLGRSLAEPNLISKSGSTASFLAGGEFPIPVRGSNGEVNVEFREFGVRLTFTPIVLGDGLINLRLAPEVSQLDRSISIDGIPGLITRKTETEVELRDGQSFAISGLLQTINERDQDAVPWLGQVPVLGTLFRSQSYAKSETDLVVIVTPRLVAPVDPGTRLRTPLDGSRPATDAEFFLAGMLEVDTETLHDIVSSTEFLGEHGHILTLVPPTEVPR